MAQLYYFLSSGLCDFLTPIEVKKGINYGHTTHEGIPFGNRFSSKQGKTAMNSKQPTYQYDEMALIGMAARGNLDAFNQLVFVYQELAYNHAYALLGDPDLAQDAAQDSFIKAFQGINGFRGGSFRGWLLKIVTNSTYDILRHSHRRPTQPLFPEDENGKEIESPTWIADPQASVETTVEHKEDIERLYQILNELPDVYRRVITLIDINELDYAEAAQMLKIPIGTVKSRLARARLQIMEKLRNNSQYLGNFGSVETKVIL
jgi:RNA polymerase sigma-70 factor, ECF subfamily